MNITVKKDGQDIEFLYSTDKIGIRGDFVFHNWTNDSHKGPEGEPFVFIGGSGQDKTDPEKMEKYRLQAEGLIKKQLGIVDVVETPVVVEAKEEEVIESKIEDGTDQEPSPEEEVKSPDDTDEDLKKKIQD